MIGVIRKPLTDSLFVGSGLKPGLGLRLESGLRLRLAGLRSRLDSGLRLGFRLGFRLGLGLGLRLYCIPGVDWPKATVYQVLPYGILECTVYQVLPYGMCRR